MQFPDADALLDLIVPALDEGFGTLLAPELAEALDALPMPFVDGESSSFPAAGAQGGVATDADPEPTEDPSWWSLLINLFSDTFTPATSPPSVNP